MKENISSIILALTVFQNIANITRLKIIKHDVDTRKEIN